MTVKELIDHMSVNYRNYRSLESEATSELHALRNDLEEITRGNKDVLLSEFQRIKFRIDKLEHEIERLKGASDAAFEARELLLDLKIGADLKYS